MKRRFATNLHRLPVRQVQVAGEGDYTDGGGLILRVKSGSAVWVLRFTAPSGRRREMGLGRVDRNNAQAIGNSITHTRQQAQNARAMLQRSIDPIDSRSDERQAVREAARKVAAARGNGLTLARACRSYFRARGGGQPVRAPRKAVAGIP